MKDLIVVEKLGVAAPEITRIDNVSSRLSAGVCNKAPIKE
jgi:hypothetical protein